MHIGTNLKCKKMIHKQMVGICFKGQHIGLSKSNPELYTWWFCASDLVHYNGANLSSYCNKKPLISEVRRILLGTNLTKKEVETLTNMGFQLVAQPNVVLGELLLP